MNTNKENIEYYLPITFVSDMKKDINLAYDNWKIKYEKIKKSTPRYELEELENSNILIEKYYYWFKVNC